MKYIMSEAVPRSFFISMFRCFEASKKLYVNRREASNRKKMKSSRVKPHSEEPP